jgi:CheY-like chemotaxis protein
VGGVALLATVAGRRSAERRAVLARAEALPVGLDLARSIRPAVVLVDIGLPDLDGYVVAPQIRAVLGLSVRLIAQTGYGQAADRLRSREAGFDAHFVKARIHAGAA